MNPSIKESDLLISAFTHAPVALALLGPDARWTRVNQQLCVLTGYSEQELLDLSWAPALGPVGASSSLALSFSSAGGDGIYRWVLKDGSYTWVSIKEAFVASAEGAPRHGISVIQEVDAARRVGLGGRGVLTQYLHQAMQSLPAHGQVLALAVLDVDDFKPINERFGALVGDALLAAIAGQIEQVLRPSDRLFSLGGDEFVVVLTGLQSGEECLPSLNQLLRVCAQPVAVNGHCLQVSVSAGVSIFPQCQSVDADQLLRQADQAMYEAKLAGKNRFLVFDAERDRTVRGRHESVELIQAALADGEFTLYFQPQVNMRTREWVGVEALIRWQHPQEGLLAPARFLPFIEGHPLYVEMGEWVIRQALRQIQDWQLQGRSIPVSVNIGAMQIQQPDFFQRLQLLMTEFPDVPGSLLTLEILETSALEDIETVAAVIQRCAELGVEFALDDFGTGYSSLTYLKRLPIPWVKVDQSFVRDMLTDKDNMSILDGVLWIMRQLKRTALAEGVETLEHARVLMDLGCEFAQGYGIGRPMPADQLPAWLKWWENDPDWQQIATVPRTAV